MTETDDTKNAIEFFTRVEDLIMKHVKSKALIIRSDEWLRWYNKAIDAKAALPYSKWEWASLIIYDIQRLIQERNK